MSEANLISDAKLKRLQTLYSQLAARSADGAARTREQRLNFVSVVVNREIASCRDLTAGEADRVIDTLQRTLGTGNSKPATRGRMGRERALRHGKDGRHDSTFANAPQMATAADLANIQEYRARLGWAMEQFEAWLRSPRSPLGRKSNPQIRTVAEANSVRWALVKMLKARGLWAEKRPEQGKSAHMCAVRSKIAEISG